MSATNRGSERQEDDFYATPFWCVDRLLEAFPFELTDTDCCYEPCVGDGAIIKAVNAKYKVKSWDGIDLRNRVTPGTLLREWCEGDFLQQTPPYVSNRFDLVITNPPFSKAEAFIKHSMLFAHSGFFLLRLNFLGSKSRRNWLCDSRPDVYVLPDRPIFTRSKKTDKLSSDATEYAWFHFRNDKHLLGRWTILNETSKEDRDKAKQDIIDAERDARTATIEAANGELPF